MNELISVIMSTYNEEENWIREAVESILNQSYHNLEFIIVIDNPENHLIHDVLYEYGKKDKRITILPNEKNLGLIKSLNKAISHTKGNWIARMDADDIAKPNRLECELSYAKENNIDFIMSHADTINEFDTITVEKTKQALDTNKFKEMAGFCNISTHPTWLLKKEVYKTLNGYRNINSCEDYDFVLRALQKGYTCYKMEEKLLYYRVRANSITRSNVLEQFMKSKYLRMKYQKNISINSITEKEVSDYYLSISENDKEKFKNSFLIFQKIKPNLNKFSNLIILLKQLITSKYFRIYFIDNAKWVRISNKNGI